MGADIPPETPSEDETEEFVVMPCNWDSVCTFLNCETQWVVAVSMAGLIWWGLDYKAVDVVLRRTKVADADAVFADLQLMEGAALDVLGEVQS